MAQVVPYAGGSEEFPQQALAGTVEILGDVVSPVVSDADCEAEGGEE